MNNDIYICTMIKYSVTYIQPNHMISYNSRIKEKLPKMLTSQK